MMYVEISGRQTGKSTRLADHASSVLLDEINNPQYKLAVVTHNYDSGLRIRDMILEKVKDKIRWMGYSTFLTFQTRNGDGTRDKVFRDKIVIICGPDDNSRPRPRIIDYYYDEFAFITERTLNSVPFFENGWYCTTPNGNQTHTLDLIRYCRENDIEILSYDMPDMMRRQECYFGTGYVESYDEFNREHGIYPMIHPFVDLPENLVGEIVNKQVRRHRF